MLENKETGNEKMITCDNCGKSPAGTLRGYLHIRLLDATTKSELIQSGSEPEADRIDLLRRLS